MSLYWVSYDLDKPGQDYPDLIADIKRAGGRRVLKSNWLVPSNDDAKRLRNRFAKFLDDNDRLLVAEVKNHAAWQNLLIEDEGTIDIFADNPS
jgi:uncharacterized protein (DUF1684 family)